MKLGLQERQFEAIPMHYLHKILLHGKQAMSEVSPKNPLGQLDKQAPK